MCVLSRLLMNTPAGILDNRLFRLGGRGSGWLREYMAHFRYKLCNYYVRMSLTSPCTPMSVSHSVFRVGGTQWVVLSDAATQNCVKNAHGGTGRRLQQAPTAVGGTSAA